MNPPIPQNQDHALAVWPAGYCYLGLQAFSEALLRFIPILSAGRFALATTSLGPALHPPDRRSLALVQAAIMLYRSCHSTTSCLNVARKGSNSDFRNRMLRPIPRRWGICFRSTRRYTVWTLTPKYTADSRTVSGSPSGRSTNPTALPPEELRWGRCFGFMPVFHAQIATDVEGDNIRIVTMYTPDPNEWGEGLRIRRNR